MSDDVRVGTTEKYPSHHLKLSDGTNTVGLKLRNNGLAIREAFQPRTPLRISQGDPNYSDQELPYSSITQADFSGGRGQEDFDDDKTRYSDSHNVDASRGEIVLGPKATAAVFDNTPTSIERAVTGTEHFPNPIGTYHIALNEAGEDIKSVVYATRFQWTPTLPLAKIKLTLAGFNKVRLIIFEYATVDLSDWYHRLELFESCLGTFPNHPYVLDQTVSIAEASTPTEYEFDVSVALKTNSWYMLSVVAQDSSGYLHRYPEEEDFVIDPEFGVSDAASTCWLKGIYGDITLREEGGGTTDSNGLWMMGTEADTTTALAFTLEAVEVGISDAHFFEYRGSLFAVTAPHDADTPPRLFMEGYHGFARAGNTGALNTTKTASSGYGKVGSEAVGAFLKLIAGKGVLEETRWRKITAVTTTGGSEQVTLDKPWNIVQDTSTEYAVVGTGKWQEITGHGMTKAVTSVCVVDDVVYFAFGEHSPAVNIRKMSFENDGGVWKLKFASESVPATYLSLIQDEKGVRKLWRALAHACEVSASDVKTYAQSLSFGTAVQAGLKGYRITGIEPYGEPRIPWIMREDGFGSIANGIYDQVPLREFAAVSDDTNGQAHLQRGVYLYLSMQHGIERYYQNRLDDIGPNRDLGLPPERNGYCNQLLAYPGRMYAGYDHPTGHSSVILYNEIGWHEIYRSQLGARLRGMAVQVIPGEACDRLWICHQGQFVWLPVAIDPTKQADYTYNSSGSIETCWYYGGFKEIRKYWHSVKIFAENLDAGKQYITLAYKVDDEAAEWVEIPTEVNTSPVQEVLLVDALGQAYNVSGRRIKLKITLNSSNPLKTPRIKAITLDGITRLPVKKSWTVGFEVEDYAVDMNGQQSQLTADDVLAQLEAWADSDQQAVPLLMNSNLTKYDGHRVFIDPPVVYPTETELKPNRKMKVVGELTIMKV